MKQIFLALALAALPAFLVGCASDPEIHYQQQYNPQGILTDSAFQQKTPSVPRETNLSKLFEKFNLPTQNTGVRIGFFFRQKDGTSGSGTDTADTLNQAAFFVLLLPENEQKVQAAKIRSIFDRNNQRDAGDLLADLTEGFLLMDVAWSTKTGFPKTITSRYNGEFKGRRNPLHGLQRTYYPNGLIRSEEYMRYGDCVTRAAFSPSGELLPPGEQPPAVKD